MLHKLYDFWLPVQEMINIYILHIRSVLEYSANRTRSKSSTKNYTQRRLWTLWPGPSRYRAAEFAWEASRTMHQVCDAMCEKWKDMWHVSSEPIPFGYKKPWKVLCSTCNYRKISRLSYPIHAKFTKPIVTTIITCANKFKLLCKVNYY